MHSYVAYSFLFIDVRIKEDFKFDQFRKTTTELIEEVAYETKYPPLDDCIDEEDYEENCQFQVEDVIEPVINIFDDFMRRNCIAINTGFCSFVKEGFNEDKLFEQYNLILMKILVKLTILIKYYGLLAWGICFNNSYVEQYHQEHMKTLIFCLGKNKDIDKYIWFLFDKKGNITAKKVDSSLIYTVFPKQYITLSKKEPLHIEIDPLKLFNLKTKTKQPESVSTKKQETKEQERQRKEKLEQERQKKRNKRRKELENGINFYLDSLSTQLARYKSPSQIPNYRLEFGLYKLNEYKEVATKEDISSLIKRIDSQISQIKKFINEKKAIKEKAIKEEEAQSKITKKKIQKKCPKCGLICSKDNSFCAKCGYYFDDK